MTRDMQTNVSGAVAILTALILHYFSVPPWIVSYVLHPLLTVAVGHLVYHIGKVDIPTPPVTPGGDTATLGGTIATVDGSPARVVPDDPHDGVL